MKCDGCEAEMTYETIELEVVVAGRRRPVAQPGWYCWTCRISAHSASDLYVAEQAYRSDASRTRRMQKNAAAR